MRSGIYQGWVRHRRFMPRRHSFRYRLFMMYLDLDELDAVLDLSPWWSTRAWHPARFQRSDFLGDADQPLSEAVRQRIAKDTGRRHQGPIRMLANLRYFGYNMNPLACYYCFDSSERLQTIVAEVNNTPWNERQSYVLPCDPEANFQRITFNKRMHVSPFNPMAMTYCWSSNRPAQRLHLNLETRVDQERHMDATLALEREEISSESLARVIRRYPLMTAKVVGAIYWQALRLWLKKVPCYGHPGTRENDYRQDKDQVETL